MDLPAQAHPVHLFRPISWRETVVDRFKMLERNHWIPCATLIMGLPGEKEEES